MNFISSNVKSADYDRTRRELKIVFVKRPMWEYTYYKIPPRIWVEFVRCESKGEYHHDIIQPKYSYTRKTIRRTKQ